MLEVSLAEAEEPQIEKDREPPKPLVLAINICDMVIRDELTHKVSLIGLFSVIKAVSFPCTHPLMHIYVALTGGHGTHDMEIRLVRTEDEQPIISMTGSVEFANPLQVHELNLIWQNVAFDKAGEYAVEVCCAKDPVPIGNRKFSVIQTGQKSLPTSGSEVE
jgi:hypothetical protein